MSLYRHPLLSLFPPYLVMSVSALVVRPVVVVRGVYLEVEGLVLLALAAEELPVIGRPPVATDTERVSVSIAVVRRMSVLNVGVRLVHVFASGTVVFVHLKPFHLVVMMGGAGQ